MTNQARHNQVVKMMMRLTIVMSLQTHGGHASETGFVKMDPVFLCLQFRQGYYM